MVETGGLKVSRGLSDNGFVVCVVISIKLLNILLLHVTIANSKYLVRRIRVLIVVAITWAKEYGLVNP